jgi:S-layer homology domain
MTRGEFIKILSLMDGYDGGEIKNNNTPFRDIKNSQYSTYIKYAISKNWVSQKNTRFRPNDTITLGEANKLINVFLEMTDGESSAIGNMLLTRDNAYSLLMSIE